MRGIELAHSGTIRDLAISPDNQILAVAHSGHGLDLYDLNHNQLRITIPGSYAQVRFHNDGLWLVATHPDLAIVDLTSETIRFDTLRNDEFVYDAEFHPNQTIQWLTHRVDRILQLHTGTGGYLQLERNLVTSRDLINDHSIFYFRPIGYCSGEDIVGGEFSQGSDVHTLVIYNLATQRLLAVLDEPEFRLTDRTNFRRQGNCFALTTTKSASLYRTEDLAQLTPPEPIRRRRGLLETISERLLGPSQRAQREARYNNLPILRPRLRIPLTGPRSIDPIPLAFHRTGRSSGEVLVRGNRSTIELRDLETGAVRSTWKFGRAWPRAIAVAPDGLTALAAMKGGSVVTWDLE